MPWMLVRRSVRRSGPCARRCGILLLPKVSNSTCAALASWLTTSTFSYAEPKSDDDVGGKIAVAVVLSVLGTALVTLLFVGGVYFLLKKYGGRPINPSGYKAYNEI